MNVLSLFDGMSCGQLALERAYIDVENYFACEIDKYAIQITQKINSPGSFEYEMDGCANKYQIKDYKKMLAKEIKKIKKHDLINQ